ncbi:TetR family transcriptional regulator [Actinomycetospora succinea]|uniref:TetR family transcriptional regulator n=1 Tax=Actinomycetospora succinea TaxID=663603 RepID=A0A4R6VTE9_9PSEU|nr:TetR/AcrR family transcriptional regulator [Actinomycetospora succinea]TDQ65944.1 TetR family transcriptional regulator [Actinomycetospora succinea]
MPRVTSPRAEATAATRAGLVEAATALFAERGFAETSIDDVAAVAGMTKGAVYHHFAGKAALFEAVFSARETEVHERLTRTLEDAPDLLTGARTALATFLEACSEPRYGRIVFRDGPLALGWERWRECERDYAYAFIARVLDGLAREGSLVRPPGTSYPTLVLGMLSSAGQLLGQAPPEQHPALREELLGFFDQVLSGMTRS